MGPGNKGSVFPSFSGMLSLDAAAEDDHYQEVMKPSLLSIGESEAGSRDEDDDDDEGDDDDLGKKQEETSSVCSYATQPSTSTRSPSRLSQQEQEAIASLLYDDGDNHNQDYDKTGSLNNKLKGGGGRGGDIMDDGDDDDSIVVEQVGSSSLCPTRSEARRERIAELPRIRITSIASAKSSTPIECIEILDDDEEEEEEKEAEEGSESTPQPPPSSDKGESNMENSKEVTIESSEEEDDDEDEDEAENAPNKTRNLEDDKEVEEVVEEEVDGKPVANRRSCTLKNATDFRYEPPVPTPRKRKAKSAPTTYYDEPDGRYYVVERILKRRLSKKEENGWDALIRWKGLDPKTGCKYPDTWEHCSNLEKTSFDAAMELDLDSDESSYDNENEQDSSDLENIATATVAAKSPVTQQAGSSRPQKRRRKQDKFWDVERVVDRRETKSGTSEYRVRWKGVDEITGKPHEDTWEPAKNLTPHCLQEAFRLFPNETDNSGLGTNAGPGEADDSDESITPTNNFYLDSDDDDDAVDDNMTEDVHIDDSYLHNNAPPEITHRGQLFRVGSVWKGENHCLLKITSFDQLNSQAECLKFIPAEHTGIDISRAFNMSSATYFPTIKVKVPLPDLKYRGRESALQSEWWFHDYMEESKKKRGFAFFKKGVGLSPSQPGMLRPKLLELFAGAGGCLTYINKPLPHVTIPQLQALFFLQVGCAVGLKMQVFIQSG